MSIQTAFSNLATSGSNNDLDANKSTPLTFRFVPGSGLSLPSGSDDGDKHQQGIQKFPAGSLGADVYGAGFAVSGSADKGYLYLTDASGNILTCITPPPFSALNLKVTSQQQYNKFNHLGGFQIAAGVLAVGLEEAGESDHGSVVLLYSLASLFGPNRTPTPLNFVERNPSTAGAVGIWPGPSNWLLLVGDYGSENLTFFEIDADPSNPASLAGATVTMIATWNYKTHFGPGSVDSTWPTGDSAYQNLNLFRDPSGSVWMIGMGNSGYWIAGPRPQTQKDWADLYLVGFTKQSMPPAKLPNSITMTKKTKLHFEIDRQDYTDSPSFMFGGGFYLNNPFSSNPGSFEAYAVSRYEDKENTANMFVDPPGK